MSDLIERNDLYHDMTMKRLELHEKGISWNEFCRGFGFAMEFVKQAPSAEPERKKGKWLNLDDVISEQNEIMKRSYSTKEKDPDAYRQFVTARMVIVYLLKKFAEQENDVFRGHWVTNENGEEICDVCWMPRKASELDGKCIMCGADMRGEE